MSNLSLTTRLLHADSDLADDTSVSPPLHQSVNFWARDHAHREEIAAPLGDRYYSRRGNPTSSRLVKVIAELEGAETGMMTSSGMGALSTAMLSLLKAGDHVVGQQNHYIGITNLLEKILPNYGVESTRVDQRSVDALAKAIRPNTKLIVLESPVNPMMHITDLKAVCEIAKARGIVTLCDNTFGTPINQQPIKLGVDLVMHSVTKYIGGHHDLLAGVLVGRKDLIEKIWDFSLTFGAIGAPFNSWLALRGIRTLELRVRQHNANGLAVAQFLERHPAIAQVFYPGLETHPQHALAKSQMSGFGGLLTFDLKGGYKAAEKFLLNLKLVHFASSLGGVSSVAVQPAAMFGEQLSAELLRQQGITPGMIRIALGIENTPDLLADLDSALKNL
jgi:cystathionine beta-lyase/cystathionine gamma-synthase